MTVITEAEMSSPKFRANPYPLYARLRDSEPVCRVRMANKKTAWLVTRYEDVVTVLKDERFVNEGHRAMTPEQAARQPWVPKAFKPLLRNLLNLDPPDHTRLRGLVHKAFTPRLVEAMRERIQEMTDDFLSAAIARGRLELIADYALPLPTTVIALDVGCAARRPAPVSPLVTRDHDEFLVVLGNVQGLAACHRVHELHPQALREQAGAAAR